MHSLPLMHDIRNRLSAITSMHSSSLIVPPPSLSQIINSTKLNNRVGSRPCQRRHYNKNWAITSPRFRTCTFELGSVRQRQNKAVTVRSFVQRMYNCTKFSQSSQPFASSSTSQMISSISDSPYSVCFRGL